MARYGDREGAVRLLSELFEAAVRFDMRLPELYCGFPRSAGEPPIAYPVACLPQAWSAGSIFMVLQACLGPVQPDQRCHHQQEQSLHGDCLLCAQAGEHLAVNDRVVEYAREESREYVACGVARHRPAFWARRTDRCVARHCGSFLLGGLGGLAGCGLCIFDGLSFHRVVPDFVALVLLFWCIRQPRLVGLGVGWTIGLITDAGNGVLLGQHALAYSILAFLAVWLSRRILWFGPGLQALHVFIILLAAQGVQLLVRVVAGNAFPGWPILVGPIIGAMLWPFVTWLLLLPQRGSQKEQAI
jgi:rod shape-determining protein MreD